MPLHRLTSITIGVPDVGPTLAYYAEFGLTPHPGGWFSTRDGGRQLHVVSAPTRRLVELGLGVDDRDDIDAVAAGLWRIGHPVVPVADRITTVEQATGVRVVVDVAPRLNQRAAPATPYNGPGRPERTGRAPGITRPGPVTPRKLGHVLIASDDYAATRRFFLDGVGLRLSDEIKGEGAFLRCSTDHHNVFVLNSPVSYLHHTSWQVDDVDDVGRGASTMLAGHPERHVWGLGRHYAGSNFFWYLKDPAGNFSEYYSDLDVIPEDEVWEPGVLDAARGLFSWGPPPPPSFLAPDDLAALMTGAHQPR
jgi:catechol 2,3-dioxygenase-like lactoylglutathione lyase family enzyme